MPYIAQLCARDWGLFHDVELNFARLHERLDAYAVEPGERDRVLAKLARLEEAIKAATEVAHLAPARQDRQRRPWHDTVEEQD